MIYFIYLKSVGLYLNHSCQVVHYRALAMPKTENLEMGRFHMHFARAL